MITKRKKTLGLALTSAFLIGLLVVGTALAVIFSRQLPYQFTESQLTTDYLLAKRDYGEYYLINDLPGVTQNPIDLDGVATAILGTSESFVGMSEADISFVSINTDVTLFDSVTEAFLNESCDEDDYSQGTVNQNDYVLAECDGVSLFLYKSADAWIIVSTPDGREALDKIIAQYKLPRS